MWHEGGEGVVYEGRGKVQHEGRCGMREGRCGMRGGGRCS